MAERSNICALVLAESYPLLLEELRRVFGADPGFRVLSCCTTGPDAVRAVTEQQADVLMLDLRIARPTAFEVLKDLGSRKTRCRVVLLADHVSRDEIAEAARLGAKGIVLKSTSGDRLVRWVRKVHRGANLLAGVSTGRTANELHDRLTPRQLEIARLVAQGCTNAEVAKRLAISEGTVKTHLHMLYKKLGIGGRLELALYIRRGISVRRAPRPAA